MPKVFVKKSRPYTEDDIQEALRLIDAGNMSLRQAAKNFRIDKSALSRRRKGQLKKQGRKTSLSMEMEKDLSEKIKIMAKWGFALTKSEILATVQTFVQENNISTQFKDGKPGNDWFQKFCVRNKLSQKKLEQLERCRRNATSDPFLIYGFYDRLKQCISDLNLENSPSHIWNLDETSFSSDPSRIKGVAGKGQKVHRNIEGSGKENTTVMACISASGVLLPPLIIFQGLNLWSSWKGQNDLPNTCYATSEKGWMTTIIFQEWFKKFCTLVTERPLLVIMDGHVTHLDKTTIELAIKENVSLFKLPAHTTDLLQPLDRCCFGPLKLKWNEALIEWQRSNQRKPTKSEFCDIICKIWNYGLSQDNIKSSFEKTGVFPCDKKKYPVHRFDPIKLSKYELNNSEEDPFNIFEDPVPENISKPREVRQDIEPETYNNQQAEASTSCSFETLLLDKIKRTPNTAAKRRKIDSSAKVLTSEEYLKEIEEKENIKPRKKEKREAAKKEKQQKKRVENKSSESESEPESIVYQDESDLENVTLQDIVDQEMSSDSEDGKGTKDELDLSENDFVLIRFNTKIKQIYYVAQIRKVAKNEMEVVYLKRKGNKFIFPMIEEIYQVEKDDIEKKLAPNMQGGTSRTAQQYIFKIDFDKYKVQ